MREVEEWDQKSREKKKIAPKADPQNIQKLELANN